MADKKQCWFCGIEMVPPFAFDRGNPEHAQKFRLMVTTEHLTPTSRGGSRKGSNIVSACFSCNARKHNRTVDEYREYLYSVSPAGIAGDALITALETKVISEKFTDAIVAALKDLEERFAPIVFWGESQGNGHEFKIPTRN